MPHPSSDNFPAKCVQTLPVAGKMSDGFSSGWTSVAMIVHIKGDLQITNMQGRRVSMGVGAAA